MNVNFHAIWRGVLGGKWRALTSCPAPSAVRAHRTAPECASEITPHNPESNRVGNPSSKRPNGLVLTRRDITTPKRNSGWERHGDGSVGCSTELGSRTERNS